MPQIHARLAQSTNPAASTSKRLLAARIMSAVVKCASVRDCFRFSSRWSSARWSGAGYFCAKIAWLRCSPHVA